MIMLFLSLFFSLAFAENLGPQDIEPQNEYSQLVQIWNTKSSRVLIEEVHRYQLSGQYQQADELLDFLTQREKSAEDQIYIQLEKGKNAEYQEKYEQALTIYESLLTQRLARDLLQNVYYRYSLVLSDLGREREALKTAQRLRWQRLSPADRRAVQLLIGSCLLREGKNRRRKSRAIRKIQRVFSKQETPQENAWLQAKSRMAMAQELLITADNISLIADENMGQQLQERADLIIQAERQVQSIIALNEPEYALKGLSQVADAMLVLYDDVIYSPAPEYFTKTQEELYRENMIEQAVFLQHKALSYYSTALRYANQLQWSGNIHTELEQKYQELQKEL